MAKVKLTYNDDGITVDISEDFTVMTINEVKKALEEVLAASKPVEILLKEVEEFDSAAFQLLYAFVNELQKRHIEYKILEMSNSVKNILTIYDTEL